MERLKTSVISSLKNCLTLWLKAGENYKIGAFITCNLRGNITGIIKSREMGQKGHAARTVDIRNT